MEKSKENHQSNKKNKSSKKIFYNIIIFILLVVIAFCLFKIGKILWGYYQGTKTYDDVAKIATNGSKDSDKIDFDKLLQKNPDTKGPGLSLREQILTTLSFKAAIMISIFIECLIRNTTGRDLYLLITELKILSRTS